MEMRERRHGSGPIKFRNYNGEKASLDYISHLLRAYQKTSNELFAIQETFKAQVLIIVTVPINQTWVPLNFISIESTHFATVLNRFSTQVVFPGNESIQHVAQVKKCFSESTHNSTLNLAYVKKWFGNICTQMNV